MNLNIFLKQRNDFRFVWTLLLTFSAQVAEWSLVQKKMDSA